MEGRTSVGCMRETGFFDGKTVFRRKCSCPVVHKNSRRGRCDMLIIFYLFVLHIRIATIIWENAKFNDKFLFWYHSAISTKSEELS